MASDVPSLFGKSGVRRNGSCPSSQATVDFHRGTGPCTLGVKCWEMSYILRIYKERLCLHPFWKEMLEKEKSWVSSAFPTFKAVISRWQAPWGLLSQRAKKREFLLLANGHEVISIFCLLCQIMTWRPRRSHLLYSLYLCCSRCI